MLKTIAFQVSNKDYYFLKQMAEDHNQSISAEIREALKIYYKHYFLRDI